MKKSLYWSPRILGIAYILFLSLFALDVFTIQSSVPSLYLIAAFLIHLIPSFIGAIFFLIAWKFEKIGGILFILFAIALAVVFQNSLSVTLILITPPITIGILFLFSGNHRNTKQI